MKIANNAAMLEVAGNSGFIYPTLIWDKNHLVLVDAGFPGQTDAIVQAISSIGFLVCNLTDIIITHQDMDHIGCVPDLRKLAPEAKVWAHTEEIPYIDGRKTPIKLTAMLDEYDNLSDDRKAWCDRLKAGLADRPQISITQALTDGEILPICGGIEVVHTPGHTPGHICLYLRDSRIMVGGDALNISDGIITGPNPQHTYDMDLGMQSLCKIKSFHLSGVVSYHCGYLEVKEL